LENFAGILSKLLILNIGERGRNRTFNLLIKSSRGPEERNISSRRRINDLPTTEPARKRFDLVLKRSTLAHLGPKRTAHLWHTCHCPLRRQNTMRCRIQRCTGQSRISSSGRRELFSGDKRPAKIHNQANVDMAALSAAEPTTARRFVSCKTQANVLEGGRVRRAVTHNSLSLRLCVNRLLVHAS